MLVLLLDYQPALPVPPFQETPSKSGLKMVRFFECPKFGTRPLYTLNRQKNGQYQIETGFLSLVEDPKVSAIGEVASISLYTSQTKPP